MSKNNIENVTISLEKYNKFLEYETIANTKALDAIVKENKCSHLPSLTTIDTHFYNKGNAANKIKKLEIRNSALVTKNSELESQNSELESQNSELENNVDVYKRSREKLVVDNDGLKNQNKYLNDQINFLYDVNRERLKELDELRNKNKKNPWYKFW